MTAAVRCLALSLGLVALVPPSTLGAQGTATPAQPPTAPVPQASGKPAAPLVPTATAAANDNRTPAGVLRGGVLTLAVVATTVRWHPEGTGPMDPVRVVHAFAEEGKTPQIPGPLVRVPEGTEIRLRVRNAIAGATLTLHGMFTRPADSVPPIEIPPGAAREVTFQAGTHGTYFYWASVEGAPITRRIGPDSQLTGAFIVDPAGGPDGDDRTFVMTEFIGVNGSTGVVSLAINGRSWPHTERLEMPFGLAATWRVVNGTFGLHPMHLHGTFYTVESTGTIGRDSLYDTDARRLVTTEAMLAGTTMMMRWVPDRVGRWLFHCHILAHVTGAMREPVGGAAEHGAGHDQGEHDVEKAMAGLVLGINVLPGDETAAPDLEPHASRPVTVRLKSWPNRYGSDPGYGFAIEDPRAPAKEKPAEDDGDEGPAPNPSPTLVLQKDEPAVITLVNEMPEATSIHWHGIELESYHDGVAGWSGDIRQTTKLIRPGQSLDVRFTPPRAGTFIYHTHGHDNRLLSSGLYAPLIVMPKGQTYDPETDKVVLIGGSGPASSDFGPAPLEVNRSLNPPPMRLKAGVTYRFRLIDISPNYSAVVTLRGENGVVQWRAVAKDGADLPPSQATLRAARQPISVGETYDFEYDAKEPGDLRLEVVRRGGNAFVTSQVVRVVKDVPAR